MGISQALLALTATTSIALGAPGLDRASDQPWPSLATALQQGLTPEQAAALRAGNVHTGIPRAEAAPDRCGLRSPGAA